MGKCIHSAVINAPVDRGWTLADKLDDQQYESLVSEAENELSHFVTADGSVRFGHPALIASATKG